MKIHARNQNKKYIIIAIVILLIGIASIATYIFAFKGALFGWSPLAQEKSGINYDKPTEEQKKAGEDIKSESVNQEKPSESTDQTPAPIPQPNGKSKVDLTITAANQNGSLLQIRTLIAYVSSSGTCTLTLTKGTQTITKTTAIQALASTSTCQGFDIAVSELSPGTWNASVNFENTDVTASATKGVSVQ